MNIYPERERLASPLLMIPSRVSREAVILLRILWSTVCKILISVHASPFVTYDDLGKASFLYFISALERLTFYHPFCFHETAQRNVVTSADGLDDMWKFSLL
jgi:hypothetical protein